METILLIIQTMLATTLIGLVIVQRSSTDGFGLGSGGGANNFMTGQAAANFLTRSTAIVATLFMVNSLALATIVARSNSSSILDGTTATPAISEQMGTEAAPAEPATPAVPLAE